MHPRPIRLRPYCVRAIKYLFFAVIAHRDGSNCPEEGDYSPARRMSHFVVHIRSRQNIADDGLKRWEASQMQRLRGVGD